MGGTVKYSRVGEAVSHTCRAARVLRQQQTSICGPVHKKCRLTVC